ncbi:MAG: hypothetical protein LC104_12405 [Bacteroidales bacterium]|nr:hypothetical protein [Bacteroidales bacterium]
MTRRIMAVWLLFAQTVTAAGLPVSTRPTGCGCHLAGGPLANCCCGPAGCHLSKPPPAPTEKPWESSSSSPSCCASKNADEDTDDGDAGCDHCGTAGTGCCCCGKPKPQPRLPFLPLLTADDCQGRPFSPPGFLTAEPGLPPSDGDRVPWEPAHAHAGPVRSATASTHHARPPTPPPRSL